MRVHSDEKIEQVKEMRSLGLSIGEIVIKTLMPKTTVWHHIRNIEIPPDYDEVLRAKRGGSKERSQKGWVMAKNLAKELLDGENRQFAIAVAMLYWAEGSKKVCEFINSDGNMIGLYLHFIRNILKLPEARIKPTMRIFTGMDQAECMRYWVELTKIPAENFVIRYNDGGLRGKTRYGMCRITIRKGVNILKLMHSLRIDVISEFNKFFNRAPVAQWIEQRTPNAPI